MTIDGRSDADADASMPRSWKETHGEPKGPRLTWPVVTKHSGLRRPEPTWTATAQEALRWDTRRDSVSDHDIPLGFGISLRSLYLLLFTHGPALLHTFPLQDEESIVGTGGFSYADTAGRAKTRRSTSRGTLRIGRHTLATWSSTQKVVVLSSAESENNSLVRCACETVGLANTIRELGREAHVRIWTDAAAAPRAGSSQRKWSHQTSGHKVHLAAAEREKTKRAQDRELRHDQSS